MTGDPAQSPAPTAPAGANPDQSLDQSIGILLRVGIYTAALVTLVGGTLFLRRHHAEPAAFGTFARLPATLRSPRAIVVAAFHGSTASLVQLGMLLLIATPVARVLFSVIAFAKRRDFLYVAISGIVLAVLAYSLIVQ